MRYFENDIYPIALVISRDVDSVNEHYWLYSENGCVDVPQKKAAEATTYCLTRRSDEYKAMAVGIIFNVYITARLAAHEGFHACYYMMDRLGIVLSDYSDEAWAYLIGWIADCIDKFKNEENDGKGVYKDVLA